MQKNGKNIKCKTCGKIFYVAKYRLKLAKYCSYMCSRTRFVKICPICKKTFWTYKSKTKIGKGKFCSTKCFHKHGKGKHYSSDTEFKKGQIPTNKGKKYPERSRENSPNWKGGRYKSRGYVLVLISNHPYSGKGSTVFEHRLIVEKQINRFLNPNEIVHHINGITEDNRPENLMAFSSISAHVRFHYSPSNVDPSEIVFDGRIKITAE